MDKVTQIFKIPSDPEEHCLVILCAVFTKITFQNFFFQDIP